MVDLFQPNIPVQLRNVSPLRRNPANSAPAAQSSGLFDAGGGLPFIGAGASILGGADPAVAISGLLSQRRQAEQDAIRAEILRREEARAQQAFALEQQAAQRQAQAQQALGNFIQTQIPEPRRSNLEALRQQALAGIEGAGPKLADGIKNDPIIQNDQIVSPDVVDSVLAESGILDLSVNTRQAENLARQREELKLQQRNTDLRAGELAARKQEGSARERKIRDNMATFKLNRQDATDLVDGNKTVVTNPQTGDSEVVNKRTGVGQQVEFEPQFVEPGSEVDQKTVFSDLENTFGPGSAFARIINDTVALLPGAGGLTDTQASAAKTRVDLLREDIIDAFAKSGRPPVVEQQRLLELLPSTGIFQNPQTAESALTELYTQLVAQRRQDLIDSEDRTLPAKERAQLRVRGNDVTRILQRLGTPRETSPERPALPKTKADFDALPDGSFFIDPGDGELYQK